MRTNSGFGGPTSDDDTDRSLPSIRLSTLLPAATFFQCDDVVVEELALDLEEIGPESVCLFQAGLDDPIEFSALALATGARAILTDQMLPCPLPQVIVADVAHAATTVMNELTGRPATEVMMVGVVGNAGKTTTALMIASVLRGLGLRTAYETNLGSCDGIVQTVDKQNVAQGAMLVRRIADARDAGCSAMVVEFSAAVAANFADMGLDLLIITGTGQERDQQRDDACFGPDPLMVALEHVLPDGIVVVSTDHPKLVRQVDDLGLKRLTYGLRTEAEVCAKVFESHLGEMTLMVSCRDETAMMETKHCGEAMAMNQLAAIATALLFEAPLVDAIALVSQTPTIPGRMQTFCGFDRASIVIDAAGDASRMTSTLRTLRQQRRGGKLWCILTLDDAHQNPRGDQAAVYGRLLEKFADRIVLTSTERHKPSFLQAAHAVLDGFREVMVARLVTDRKRAIQWAVQKAAPNDIIVVLGGMSGQTACEQRTAIQTVEKLVSRCLELPTRDRHEGPTVLKFPGVS